MFQSWTASRLKADLAALEASAERAGASLACVYSCSEEFEAAMIRLRRGRGCFDGRASAQMRLVLMATVSVAVVALAVMAF